MIKEDADLSIIQQTWPEWRIVRRLGAGSFGVVYEAVNESRTLVARSAIKLIRFPKDEAEIHAAAQSLDLNTADALREYFRPTVENIFNEVRLMEELRSSGLVVTVQDYLVLENPNAVGWTILIRMELLESLSVYRQGKVVGVAEVIRIGQDLCRALAICHQRKIIHRDVKESNIFRSEHGTYKLGDFGISRHLESSSSSLSHKGTGSYMAPEIMRGERYDFSVDIYSLGIVLYRLCNRNRLPFVPADGPITVNTVETANQRRFLGEIMPPPVDANPELAAVILRACAADPQARYGSAEEMGDELSFCLGTVRRRDEGTAIVPQQPWTTAPSKGDDSFSNVQKQPTPTRQTPGSANDDLLDKTEVELSRKLQGKPR